MFLIHIEQTNYLILKSHLGKKLLVVKLPLNIPDCSCATVNCVIHLE